MYEHQTLFLQIGWMQFVCVNPSTAKSVKFLYLRTRWQFEITKMNVNAKHNECTREGRWIDKMSSDPHEWVVWKKTIQSYMPMEPIYQMKVFKGD